MANTLTGLIPDIYEALDMVLREQVGLIPAVYLGASSERAAKDQTIISPVAPAATATDITPGVTPPDDGDQMIGNVQLTISKARRVPVRWNGEQSLALDAPGLRRFVLDGVVTVEVDDGESEDRVARTIKNAFEDQLDTGKYDIEIDDGEDVLIKKDFTEPDFALEIVSSTVKSVRLRLQRE